MSTEHFIAPNGIIRSGRVHPEIKDLARKIANRDRKALTRHRCRSFLRLPYADLCEAELLKGQGWKEPNPPIAVLVVNLSTTEAARIPLDNQERVDDALSGNCKTLDLRRSTSKGFGRGAK
jgi:hypothetical protein